MHPLDAMECPGCGTTLPQTATSCPCGYTFVTGAPSKPAFYVQDVQVSVAPKTEGSFFGGLALGLFCGCIGIAIAHYANLGPQTKRGTVAGFFLGVVAGVVLRLRYYGS